MWFTIRSDPIDVFLKRGERKEVDLDADGTDDLAIALEGYTAEAATFTLGTPATTAETPAESHSGTTEDISTGEADVQVPQEPPQGPSEAVPVEERVVGTPTEDTSGSRSWWIWTAIIATTILVIAGIILRKKR